MVFIWFKASYTCNKNLANSASVYNKSNDKDGDRCMFEIIRSSSMFIILPMCVHTQVLPPFNKTCHQLWYFMNGNVTIKGSSYRMERITTHMERVIELKYQVFI